MDGDARGGRALGWKDFLEDRSEPDHVEVLLLLGELERARRVLEHLEWRGRTLPRSWIDAALPRARALILAAEGDVAAALAELAAAPRFRRFRSSVLGSCSSRDSSSVA